MCILVVIVIVVIVLVGQDIPLLRYVGISWATLSCPTQPVVKKSSDEVVKLIIMSSCRFEAFWDPTVSYMYMDDKQHNPWYIDLGECSN